MSIDRAARQADRDAAAAPRLGWYGDDFTGATDTLAAVAQARLRALLFLGVPTPSRLAAAGPLDAIGIAGAARTMDAAAMHAELEPVGRFFSALGVPVLHYKVCSTFDSAPTVGSIGTAIRALRPYVASAFVPIVGGQPNIGRYCAFSNLFAAAGIGGAVHRIDRHPTMSRHPVTPMHEADLRRHLAAQGLPEPGAIHYPCYERSDADLDALLQNELAGLAPHAGGALRPVLFDVAHASHLAAVGRLIWQQARQQRLLAVGPSSVVQALVACRAWPDDPGVDSASALAPAAGPVFALSGSLSPVTARQVAAAAGYERIAADVSRLMAQQDYAEQLVQSVTVSLRARRNVLVHTQSPEGTAPDPERAASVAQATADLVAQVVKRMAAIAPLRRIGIAGGDTSSRVAQALGLWGLSYLTTMGPGVTVSRAHSDESSLDGLELMLKGGQMGPEDLFAQLLTGN